MKKTYLLIGLMAATLMAAGCGETGKTTETAALESVAETAATETAAETAAETSATETAMESETETETEEVWEGSLKDLAADYFTLGVGINGSTPDNQTLNIPQYMELSAKHFNSCTMTNLMKSGYILDQPLYGWPVWTAFICPASGAVVFCVIYFFFRKAMRFYRSTGS